MVALPTRFRSRFLLPQQEAATLLQRPAQNLPPAHLSVQTFSIFLTTGPPPSQISREDQSQALISKGQRNGKRPIPLPLGFHVRSPTLLGHHQEPFKLPVASCPIPCSCTTRQQIIPALKCLFLLSQLVQNLKLAAGDGDDGAEKGTKLGYLISSPITCCIENEKVEENEERVDVAVAMKDSLGGYGGLSTKKCFD
ncbi:hypothetical protein M5K25_006414 [Dendrobium thyrsiflorum]|uniref:Uncharacterized protein n=1 Tax=Dendrobium thyrsiflorum TaxID=117978 RepID=A0ABD0VB66_DENTH